ncbi:hypothetical protein VNO78_37468 [Psophocarpus tetragonolobus]|uniref:Cytochrome c oxidase subunit 3 n=1 Tax=Psophocarpus tetragonolobus TaxID=3891 RepID=A0AAN9RFD4_PSOTE
MIESQRHSYHLVDPSPWPISGSLGALATTVGGVMYMHSFQGGATLLSLGLIFILYTMFVWWRDVLRESTLEGHHTKVVQLGPRYGSIPFIVSEVMFLFAFFRASSHSSLAPTVEIGGIWPPLGIWVLDPREIPFLNTPILLSSGAAVTWAHHAILAGKEKRAVYALVATVSLALVFTGFQGMEYYQAPFTISDSIYGSTFFLATGFHGFHVIIGTLFLIICGIRQYLGHLTKEHHVGFEAAAWYWHFVDVVRLFLFVSIYWWGGNVRNRELTIIQRRVLRRLRNKKRSIKRKISPRKNMNSYIQSQTTRKLPLFHALLVPMALSFLCLCSIPIAFCAGEAVPSHSELFTYTSDMEDSGRSSSTSAVNQPLPGEQAMPPALPVMQEAASHWWDLNLPPGSRDELSDLVAELDQVEREIRHLSLSPTEGREARQERLLTVLDEVDRRLEHAREMDRVRDNERARLRAELHSRIRPFFALKRGGPGNGAPIQIMGLGLGLVGGKARMTFYRRGATGCF